MAKKTTLAASNFNKNNTPETAQKIGDMLLVVGTAGAGVATLILTAPLALPVATIALLTQVAVWAGVVGGVGKIVSKMFGKEPSE